MRKPLVGAGLVNVGWVNVMVGLVIGAAATAVPAAEIVVFSAGAAKEAVLPLTQAFAQRTGHKVEVTFGTMGLIQQKLGKGERADVLVVAAEIADTMQQSNTILGDTRKPLARVGVGVAVHETAVAPDISTPEAFKATLLKAKSIVMIDPKLGTSGKHLVEVYARLAVTELLQAKMQYGSGGYIVTPVGEGKVELGLHQISEILPVKGVKLVGPLPEALQKWTVYTAAITPSSQVAGPARELIQYLSSAEARPVYLSKGFTPPE